MPSQIKTLFIGFLIFYSTYLLNYKCAKLNESTLEHSAEVVLHPLSHTHNQLCDGLNSGVNFVDPYLTKAHKWLDNNVHSHALFKKYEVESYVTCAKGKYYKYVYPYVIELYKLLEVAEVHLYQLTTPLFAEAEKLYHTYVSPKVSELKGQAASKLDDVKSKL